jgi:PfaB family protein
MIREVAVVAGNETVQFHTTGISRAIRAIEGGETDSALVTDSHGSVLLMERSAARRDGKPCLALISIGQEVANGEDFSPGESICAAVEAAALAIFYRHLPTGPGRATPRPWLAAPRFARVQADDVLTLSETEVIRPVTTLAQRAPQLVLFTADSPDELTRGLSALETDGPLPKIASATRARCGDHRFALSLIARNREELVREISLATAGIARAVESGAEWKTPSGSCFAPVPLGAGGVAFVFPGVGSPYLGVGAELFAIAPRLMEDFERLTRGEAARYLHADEIYPRGAANTAALFADVVALGECAVSISAILTMLVRDILGVTPRSALGYSFGEAIMPAALGVWPEPTVLTARLDSSPTFRRRLHGRMEAIRESWNLPAEAPLAWRSYAARATPAEAFAALKPESRAYLCIINSPEEAVIAGEEAACARVLSRLGTTAVPMPLPLTMHCEPARSEHPELVRIHDLETVASDGIALFSCAQYQPVRQEAKTLAAAIADGYTRMVDFPRLVRQVYANGAHIFLEIGGRRNCSTWIEKILRGRPHAAIPCDAQGLSSDAALLRAIARLFTHRVPLRLSALES